MSNTTWDEIKKLAADFQRIQLVENSFKLSERNCIEIINKLIESGLLNVVHTIDGKDFLTIKQVEKEIYDELYVHEGRINIVKLQTLLNIDISHIEVKVSDIVKDDPNLVLILGQIISKDYMNKIAEEINEMLQEKESVSISELTNIYELPADFIHQVISPRVGNLIKGNFDGKILFTFNFVNKQKALLKGALEACLKPVRFSQIIKEYNLENGMIFDIFNELLTSGQIKGTLFGGKQEMSAVFVPEFYAKAQKQYVESFFKQNGYIDYSNMKKIGISEPDAFAKSLFENQNNKYLSSSCFASYYLNNLEEDIEDILNRNGFCDLTQILPSILNEKDLNIMGSFFIDQFKSKNDTSLLIMAENYIVKKDFLKDLNSKFQIKMEGNAEEDLKKPTIVLAFRAERAVIAGSQSSSNNQNNSSTSKQSKSKAKKTTNESQQNENLLEISFMDKTNLIKELKSMINELDEELVEPLVEHFLRPLNYSYFELLKTKIESGLVVVGETSEKGGPTQASNPHKNTIKEVQEKVKLLLINAKIFEKALKSLSDPKVQDIITKHLAKTCFTDIFNEILKFIATEQLISFNEESLNPDTRSKILQKLKEPSKKELVELNQALLNKPCNEIIELSEKVASELLEFPIKKADTKREKEVIIQLRESTKESLRKEEDPATILHQACILLHHHSTGLMLNAPGRCVPNILEALKTELNAETYLKLNEFQNLVIKNLNKSKTTDEVPSISLELVDEIRSIGLNAKNCEKLKN